MAIAPLEQRLDQLAQESADLTQRKELASVNPDPIAESQMKLPLTEEIADQGVQVAGGRLDVIKEIVQGVSKKIGGTEIRKPPAPLTGDAAKAADSQDLTKVLRDTGVGTATELKRGRRIMQNIDEVAPTTPTPEQVISEKPSVAGMTDEKPPKAPFNMPLMDTDESVKQTMLAMANRVETKTGTFDNWQKSAEAAGFGAKFIDELTNGKLAVTPENVILASKAQVGVMEHLDGLLTKVADGSATPTELAEASQAIAFSNVIQQSVKGYQTNIAQSLAVMRMPRSSGPEVDAILEQFGSQTDIVKFAQAYLDVKTPEGKANLIKSMAQGNAWEKLFTVYVNGILSRPGTQVKNALSNTIFLPWRMVERGAAAGIGGLRKGLGIGEDNAYELVEIPSMLASTPTAISNGWQLMAHAFTNGVPKGWSDPTKIARQQARMDLFNARDDGSLLSAAIKGLNYVTTLPGRSLMAADEFFKGINYTYELAAESSRVGIQTFDNALKEGMSVADARVAQQNAIDQFFIDPPDYIAGLAEKGTFTQKLEGTAGKIQSSLQPNTALGFILRTQAPFIATPVNVMAETVSRSPLGMFSRGLWTDIAKGGTKESDMAIAKVGLGSAAMYGFSSMTTNGLITGSGPGEKGTREAMQRQGWQPYSFVIDFDGVDENVRQALSAYPGQVRYGSGDYQGKVFLSYQGMEPVGALMAMAADYTDYARYEQDDSRVNAVAGGLVFGIANYMMESPFLQGVSNIMTALGNYKPNNPNSVVLLANSVAQIATTTMAKAVTPLSGLITSVAEKIDPTRRDYQVNPNAPAGIKGMLDGFNKIRSQIPGLSSDLPPMLNIWAEPVDHEYSWSPIRMKEGKTREVDQGLIQLNANINMPTREVSMVDPETGINASTKLTALEYNKMLKIANEQLGLEDQVKAVLKTIELDNNRNSLFNYQKAIDKVFNDVFTGTNETPGAKKYLLQDPTFGPAIQERIAEKAKKLDEFGKGAK